MRPEQLRELQAPLKDGYRERPEAALVTLRARARLGLESLTCKVETLCRPPALAVTHSASGPGAASPSGPD